MENEHLVPEIIFNLVDKYKKSTQQNEKFSLEARLKAIIEACNAAIQSDLNKRLANKTFKRS